MAQGTSRAAAVFSSPELHMGIQKEGRRLPFGGKNSVDVLPQLAGVEKFQNVGKKKAAEEAPKAEEAPAPAIAQSEAADEDFADDLELVAVISAAIAAYENTSGDSFVVRSIKKSNKWHRA